MRLRVRPGVRTSYRLRVMCIVAFGLLGACGSSAVSTADDAQSSPVSTSEVASLASTSSDSSTVRDPGGTVAEGSPYVEVDFGLLCRTEEVNGGSAQELGFTAAADPDTALDLFVQSSDLLGPRPTQEREMISETADQLEFFYRRDDGSPDVYLRVDLEGTSWVVREFASCGF